MGDRSSSNTKSSQIYVQKQIPRDNNNLDTATDPNIVDYYHDAYFSPVQATWLNENKQGALK